MGTYCPCGVRVYAESTGNNVRFEGVPGTITGNLTYRGNVCVTTLCDSTLTLSFVDTETDGAVYSFDMVADTIDLVVCQQRGQNCVVTVTGMGSIGDVTYLFEAVFVDQVSSSAVDNVQSFVITNYFDQNGAAPVPQGAIVALGCE